MEAARGKKHPSETKNGMKESFIEIYSNLVHYLKQEASFASISFEVKQNDNWTDNILLEM